MTYTMSAADATKLYLYGSLNVPGNLADPAVPLHPVAPVQQFDIQQYMTLGAGRFGRPSQFVPVNLFFSENGPVIDDTGLGKSFTLAQVLELTVGNVSGDYIESVTQALYDDGSDDLIERTFVFGTSTFILKDATFVIDADGKRHIGNIVIQPNRDNFDFIGGPVSNAANYLLDLEKKIDPWKIGQPVKFEYTGSAFTIVDYSKQNWETDTHYISSSFHPLGNIVEGLLSNLTNDLFSAGITRFIDGDGRAIYYGSGASETLKTGGAGWWDDHAPLLASAALGSGVHVVAGGGFDTVTGNNKDDVLDGNSGNDILDGGLGKDVLNGGVGTDTAKFTSSEDAVHIDLVTNTGTSGSAEGDTYVSIENVMGSEFDDRMMGNGGVNKLEGGIGNDVLVGGDGIDKLYGGAGSDLLLAGKLNDTTGSGAAGEETIVGGPGADYIVLSDASASSTVITNGDASDHLLLMPHMVGNSAGASGSLQLFALTGGVALLNDTTNYSYDGQFIQKSEGSNLSTDENGVEYKSYYYTDQPLVPEGNGFAEPEPRDWYIEYRLYESANRLVIVLLGGNDFRVTINDWHDGDYGINLNEYLVSDGHLYDDNTPANWIALTPGEANNRINELVAESDRYTLSSALELSGGTQRFAAFGEAAILTLDDLVITVSGTDGTDKLVGTDLGERLSGLADNDRLFGMGGDDKLQGGDGADLLRGGKGADVINGGDGVDTADYRTSTEGVTVDLAFGTGLGGEAVGDEFVGIEGLLGSNLADNLRGDAGINRLAGNSGDDLLAGGDGNDVLIGGAGADQILGGAGDRDVADYRSASSAVVLSLATGGTLGDALGDTYDGVEFVYGSDSADVISGNTVSNRLVGGEGNDSLNGGDGRDTLLGEEGDDELSGGTGNDVFLFGPVAFGNDVVTDFVAGAAVADRVSLQHLGISTFAEALSHMADTGAGTVLSLAAGTITFSGVAVSQFAANDFLFG